MATSNPGGAPNGRLHFDATVATYDAIRPDYPAALIADIIAYSGSGKAALEIGAGTGKATAPFLAAGYDVTAIEIGENMSGFLRERFGGNESFRVITAAFEDAEVRGDSFDLIYAAAAFHWVNTEIGGPKAFRLLRRGGAIALLRYNVLPAGGAPDDEIQAVYDEHYYTYHTTGKAQPTKKRPEEYASPPSLLKSFGIADLGAFGFRDTAFKLYEATQTLSTTEFLAMRDTFPDHRQLPEKSRAALYAGIRDAIERHGGQIGVEYVFQLYMGRKP